MRTYGQLDGNEKTQAQVVAQQNLLETWLADPFHVFPRGTYKHELLTGIAAEVGPEGLREGILTDRKLQEWLDEAAIQSARRAFYLDTLPAENVTVIDLRDGSMFVLESVVR